MIWAAVPLGSTKVTVALLGKCLLCVRDYDPAISGQVLRLPGLSDPVGAEGRVVEDQLVYCHPTKLGEYFLPGSSLWTVWTAKIGLFVKKNP